MTVEMDYWDLEAEHEDALLHDAYRDRQKASAKRFAAFCADPTPPRLTPVDLTRGERSRHPDIEPGPTYLARIDGQLFIGRFHEVHYGWSFASGWGASGHQFNTPGYNSSRWEALWRID